jgi:hypothetical protein
MPTVDERNLKLKSTTYVITPKAKTFTHTSNKNIYKISTKKATKLLWSKSKNSINGEIVYICGQHP